MITNLKNSSVYPAFQCNLITQGEAICIIKEVQNSKGITDMQKLASEFNMPQELLQEWLH